jgi:3-deoxy-7-phosphoheptulonate synthase
LAVLVLMRRDATAAEVDRVLAELTAEGVTARRIPGGDRPALAAIEGSAGVDPSRLTRLPGVSEVVAGGTHRLASRSWRSEPTRIMIGDVTIGGDAVGLIAGPCAVESEDQLVSTARHVASAGAHLLRGGAFKPRSSPYAFQGLGTPALDLLVRARAETGLPIVTEALDEASLEQVAGVADVIQIGSRNMGNTALLRRAADTGKPLLLKRGMAATVDELLLAAEYVLASGNPQLMLCERGVRGFDGSTRFLFDVAAIPLLKQLSHLPVVADPSHATGRRDLVPAMAKAAVAAGADALLLEVHPDPDRARSDGAQSLTFDGFTTLVEELRAVADAVGRRLVSRAGTVP